MYPDMCTASQLPVRFCNERPHISRCKTRKSCKNIERSRLFVFHVGFHVHGVSASRPSLQRTSAHSPNRGDDNASGEKANASFFSRVWYAAVADIQRAGHRGPEGAHPPEPGSGEPRMGRKNHKYAHNRTSISAIAKAAPQAKKLAQLRQQEEERREKLAAEIDSWFKQFDFNQDGKLQREELRALLAHLEPERPATEENLDFLLEKATAIETYTMRIAGDKNGAVSWHEARKTVELYHEYCRDQKYLDSVFERFDYDKNGTLDLQELPALLQEVAPPGATVDISDAEFIMEQCDANGDGVISRDEVIPMLATWKKAAAKRLSTLSLEERETERSMSPSWSFIRHASKFARSPPAAAAAAAAAVTGENQPSTPAPKDIGLSRETTASLQECSSPPSLRSPPSPEPSTGSTRSKGGASQPASRMPTQELAAGPASEHQHGRNGGADSSTASAARESPDAGAKQKEKSSMCVLL